jgi:two-component sensor histidine kinase
MQWINRFRRIKIVLIACAAVIAAVSLFVSDRLVTNLKQEELRKMQVWAEAMRSLNSADENTDLNLVLTVLDGNNTIPVIVTDSKGAINNYRNISIDADEDSLAVLHGLVSSMRENGNIIRIEMGSYAPDDYIEVCYDDSLILTQLAYYPYVQLMVAIVFFLVCLVAILSSKRAEQDRVWVGLSKETAHQLGTPISSLMAWTEVLRDKYPGDELLPEMEKDVTRLRTIAERFSKIGSTPEPQSDDLIELLERVVAYIKRRSSSKVQFVCNFTKRPLYVRMNSPLMEWVIENLCKNAIDAMNGEGTITINVTQSDEKAIIDLSDTGKGIQKSRFAAVFEPGYTTKKRGWGLGLSLAKRIIESYHRGRIYVKHSELNKGTTFRIELKK